MGAFGGDDFTEWYCSINLVIAILGVITAVITLMVIQRIPYTGHMHLLWYMSFWQLWTDLFIFTTNVDFGPGWLETSVTIEIPTGIASAVVSNWMIFVAFHVVMYRKSFDVFAYSNWIWITSLVPGLVTTAVYLVGVAQDDTDLISVAIIDLNNSMRLASIGFNFLLILIIIYKVAKITPKGKKITKKSLKDTAIRMLCFRMVFYPIVQAIGRSGYAWYEFQYGPYRTDDSLSEEKKACLIYLSVVTPLVSIGYLVLLCLMQPQAYAQFCALITCQSSDTVGTDPLEGSGSTRPDHFTSVSDTSSVQTAEYTVSTVPSRWFSFRPTHNNHNHSIISNLSNALMGEQHLSEVDNNSIYSNTNRMTQQSQARATPFTGIKNIRSYLTPAAPPKSAFVVTTEADKQYTFKSASEEINPLQVENAKQSLETAQPTPTVAPMRISDRMSEELAKRFSHRTDTMSEADWQEVYRISMAISDIDLLGLVEEIEEDSDRDSELSPVGGYNVKVGTPPPMGARPSMLFQQENMFLRDDRMSWSTGSNRISMMSAISRTIRGPSISSSQQQTASSSQTAPIHSISPHNTSSTISSRTNSETIAAANPPKSEMELNGFKPTDTLNRMHQKGDV